jgi:hypothetical protein
MCEVEGISCIKPSAKKACQSTAASEPEALDDDSILVDIDVESVGDSGSTCEGKTVDIDQFSVIHTTA